MKILGGAAFVYNGIKFDYCFKETIKSLQELCDQVCICVIKSDDGTEQEVRSLINDKTKVIVIDEDLWLAIKGKEKLSYFSNIAIANLSTDWIIYCQADEVLHQDSFPAIRAATYLDNEAYMCTRLNLWRDPYSMLNVEGSRNPCSPQVIRLAKRKYRCVDDAESIAAPVSFDFVNDILIYHMGFVRKREVMKSKIINMQTKVFGMTDYDKRLDAHEHFEAMDYFEPHELIPIPKPLPKYIQKWAAERTY